MPLPVLLPAALLLTQPAKPEVAPSKVLTLGSPAPELKVSRWVKGSPHTSLQKGKVYVVEFWATWCGPCRQSIPHLTELAQKHKGKVAFLGVDVWERPKPGQDVDKLVDDFVKEMGAKMDYDVARDTADAFMSNAWMKAAERNGIPCAFVVDAQGRIAWIGHPMYGLDQVLEDVLAGRHDLAKAAATYEKEQAEARQRQERQSAVRKAMQEVGKGLQEAEQARDYPRLLTLVDQAVAKYPVLTDQLAPARILALVRVDEALARQALDALKDKPAGLGVAEALAETDGLAKGWYEQASQILAAALAKPESMPLYHEPLAKALFRLGRSREAAESQQKLVDFARANKAPEEYLKRFEADLKTYREAK